MKAHAIPLTVFLFSTCTWRDADSFRTVLLHWLNHNRSLLVGVAQQEWCSRLCVISSSRVWEEENSADMWLEEVSFHVTTCVWTDCACDLLKMFWDPFRGLWMPMELSWQATYSHTIVKTMIAEHGHPDMLSLQVSKRYLQLWVGEKNIRREPMHRVLKHQKHQVMSYQDAGFNALHAAAR